MFGRLHKPLSSFFNYYLDFSRVGELLNTRHRYTNREIAVRGSMIALVAASGVVAAYVNEPEKSGWGDFTIAAATTLLSFVAVHTAAIAPLIMKRRARNHECEVLKEQIRNRFPVHSIIIAAVTDTLQDIMSLSLADDVHSRASETWGMRLRTLGKLNNDIADGNIGNAFWLKSRERRIEILSGKSQDDHVLRPTF